MRRSKPTASDADRQQSRARLWLCVFAGVGAWWAGLLLGPLGLIGLALTAGAVYLAGRERQWLALAVALLAIPPPILAALAAVDYAQGDARLFVERTPHATLHNIDPETRCARESKAESTWVRRAPHNATLRALTALFGPMPGAYDGPYPSPGEAQAALADGARWPAHAPRLPPAIGQMLDGMTDADTEVTTAVWQARVGLVQVSRIRSRVGPGPGARSHASILVDQDSGMVLAYTGEIGLLDAGLPVPWRQSGPR